MVLRMVFAKKLPYRLNEGFRTTKNEELSLPFKLLKNMDGGEYEMAQVRGETSNRLFQTLGEWNAILQGSPLYVANLEVDSKMLNPHGL